MSEPGNKVNIHAFMMRLVQSGFQPRDYVDVPIADGLVIVEGIKPPGSSTGGVLLPDRASAEVPVQLCLLHRVVAIGGKVLVEGHELRRGDVVKCKEAHLDPLDHKNVLASTPGAHIKAIVLRHEDLEG